MQHIDFEGSNSVLGGGDLVVRRQRVQDLHVRIDPQPGGNFAVTSCWMLSEEEIARLRDEPFIYVSIYSGAATQPPIVVFTADEE